MRRTAALLLVTAAFLGRGQAFAATTGEVWNEVFTADEQRILYAIKADPTADAALKAGLAKVVKADPKSFEAEKRRFQAEWLGRIQTFASSYKPGSGQGVKPTADQARAKLPWLAEVDKRDWEGKLVPAVLAKFDPQELGYNIANLQSLDEADKKKLTDKLGLAKTFRYSPESVADEMLKAGRETMGQVLTGLASDTPARLASAKQQLAAAEQALASARTAPDENAAAGSSPVFDNARPPAGAAPAPGGSVVDARDQTGQAPPAESRLKPPPALTGEPAGSTLPGAARPDDGEIPPPKAPAAGEKTYASAPKSGGLGASIAGAFKSPVGKGGLGGAALGAIAGFFLGGPIGALIGLFVGAAAGAGVMMATGSSAAPAAESGK
ncbi:hypothetical protein EPO15_15680 [bacterium]|nr:MAG: hypothetical protein EPO15_15680 [bacterium]